MYYLNQWSKSVILHYQIRRAMCIYNTIASRSVLLNVEMRTVFRRQIKMTN